MPFQMKTLTILGLVQTALLLFLLGKIVLVDEETSVAARAEQNTLVSDYLADTQSQSHSGNTYIYPDEDRLRQIIREELAALPAGGIGAVKQAEAEVVLSSTDNAENQYQREQVAQQLNYYTSVGRISDADMQKLQGEIAKLDEASRTEMLRMLTRALNSGQLEGRL